MHPGEHAASPWAGARLIPVRLQGYRRSFSQEPSWRQGDGASRGVLTVRRAADHWCNGILLQAAGLACWQTLDHRERGYVRQAVTERAIAPYDATSVSLADVFIFEGREAQRNEELLPNRAYLELCLTAAREWSEPFYRDFLETTYVGQRSLRDYVESLRVE